MHGRGNHGWDCLGQPRPHFITADGNTANINAETRPEQPWVGLLRPSAVVEAIRHVWHSP